MLTLTHTHQPSRWNWRFIAWAALVGLVMGGAQLLELWL